MEISSAPEPGAAVDNMTPPPEAEFFFPPETVLLLKLHTYLTFRVMGGQAAWRALLDDLVRRGMNRPDPVMLDGGSGRDAALATPWCDVPVQRSHGRQASQSAGARRSDCTRRFPPITPT